MARCGVYGAAALAALVCALPFLWSLISAFKQNQDLYNPESDPFLFNLFLDRFVTGFTIGCGEDLIPRPAPC